MHTGKVGQPIEMQENRRWLFDWSVVNKIARSVTFHTKHFNSTGKINANIQQINTNKWILTFDRPLRPGQCSFVRKLENAYLAPAIEVIDSTTYVEQKARMGCALVNPTYVGSVVDNKWESKLTDKKSYSGCPTTPKTTILSKETVYTIQHL